MLLLLLLLLLPQMLQQVPLQLPWVGTCRALQGLPVLAQLGLMLASSKRGSRAR
jgi:hypothetical protein